MNIFISKAEPTALLWRDTRGSSPPKSKNPDVVFSQRRFPFERSKRVWRVSSCSSNTLICFCNIAREIVHTYSRVIIQLHARVNVWKFSPRKGKRGVYYHTHSCQSDFVYFLFDKSLLLQKIWFRSCFGIRKTLFIIQVFVQRCQNMNVDICMPVFLNLKRHLIKSNMWNC